MPVIRKPKGRIRVLKRHRSPKGKIFSTGEEYDWFGIVERRECGCNGKKGKLMYKLYKTRYGLIPTTKAEKL